MKNQFSIQNYNVFLSPRYLRLPIKEVTGMIVDSSNARHEVFDRFGKPKCKHDAINMLGDQSGKVHTVFRENGGNEFVKTIAVGRICIFDIFIYF